MKMEGFEVRIKVMENTPTMRKEGLKGPWLFLMFDRHGKDEVVGMDLEHAGVWVRHHNKCIEMLNRLAAASGEDGAKATMMVNLKSVTIEFPIEEAIKFFGVVEQRIAAWKGHLH